MHGLIAALIVGLACAILSACVAPPATTMPTAAETSIMNSALRPSSQEAANAAVQRYFDKTLFDAPAARWRFNRVPVRDGLLKTRQFGWFMCGEINGKNRMGGYTGWHEFLAYFSPTQRDVVIDGNIAADDNLDLTRLWCANLYRVPNREL